MAVCGCQRDVDIDVRNGDGGLAIKCNRKLRVCVFGCTGIMNVPTKPISLEAISWQVKSHRPATASHHNSSSEAAVQYLLDGQIVDLLRNDRQFGVDRFGVVVQRGRLAQDHECAQHAGHHEEPQKESVEYHRDKTPVLVLLGNGTRESLECIMIQIYVYKTFIQHTKHSFLTKIIYFLQLINTILYQEIMPL